VQKKLEETMAVLAENARRDDAAEVRNTLAQAQKSRRAGDDEAALAVVRTFLQEAERAQAERAQDLKRVASALESLEAWPAAEEVFRQYAESGAGTDGQLALISFLSRRNRVDEALELCDRIAGTASAPMLARVSLGVLRAGPATPEQIARVEARIVEAAEKAGPETRTGFDLALAELREIQGRFPDVLKIYRGLLVRNNRNVLALNNLAWFQSFDPVGRRESLDLINRALQLAGPDPELLDTRAVIQLNLDSPREAIRDLEQALKENSTPSLWFHLSLAQSRVGDKSAAAESLRNADQAGFDPGTLHPFEKADYEKLMKSLSPEARRSRG
jgi:tetratricopeptide (TPR) repeat protein